MIEQWSDDVPEYLTRAEVAQLLRVHPTTITRLVKDAGLPVVYFGPSSPRFDKAEILAWNAQRKADRFGLRLHKRFQQP